MTPAVSIGLPVYNGVRFLPDALTSLLAQEHVQFELLISDNASTDATEPLCRALRDPRIRYVRQSVNRGAAWNFAYVLAHATAPYFLWAAADDRWAPTFLRRCRRELDAHPDAVLCHSQGQEMSPEGDPFGRAYTGLAAVDPQPRRRWRQVLADLRWHIGVYGVMRTCALRHTRGLQATWGSDHVLMAELALQGPLRQVPATLWWHRRPVHISPHEAYSLVLKKLDPAQPIPPRRWTALAMHRQYWALTQPRPMGYKWDVVWNYGARGGWKQDVVESLCSWRHP